MGYIYWDGFWRCRECGYINPPEDVLRCACGRERTYEMTYAQARAVARKLNSLERECDDLKDELEQANCWIDAYGPRAAKIHELQPCGHERRFIAREPAGTEWCALCQVMNLRIQCRDLAAHAFYALATQK